jgi:thiamine biosynthesis protein ThiS
MQITVNGEPFDEAREGWKVADLLTQQGLATQRLAVLLDDEVVRRADFGQTLLREGCRVEIVQMVGGG